MSRGTALARPKGGSRSCDSLAARQNPVAGKARRTILPGPRLPMPEPIQITRDDPAAAFEPYRAYLRGLAYRMLSSMAEAEDAVQDAYIRWHRIGAKARAGIENPRA